jgi:hypothetical protein
MQLKQFEQVQLQHRLQRVVVNNNPKPPRRPPVVPNQNGQRADDRPEPVTTPKGVNSGPPKSPRSAWS